jgi:hypothetical protein
MRKSLILPLILSLFSVSTYAQKGGIVPDKILQIAFPNYIALRTSEVNCTNFYPTPPACGNLIRNINFTPLNPSDIGSGVCFNYNRVPEWAASSGTPDLYDFCGANYYSPPIPLSSPSPATGFAGMVYYSGPFGNNVEGIAQKIPDLQAGAKYAFSFFKAVTVKPNTNSNIRFKIELIRCSLFSSFPQNNAEPIFPPGTDHQTIYCELNPNSPNWQRTLFSFTANSNYDVIMITPSLTTTFTTLGSEVLGCINFAYPELININNFSAGNPPTPTFGNCTVTIGPNTPNCGVSGAIFIWHGPNGQTITAPGNQQIQVDASVAANQGTWTLEMTVPSIVANTNNCVAALLPVKASVVVPACPSGLWPKAYGTKPAHTLFLTDNGNIVMLFAPLPASPYMNHTGLYLPNTGISSTMQYSLTGFTNWTSNLYPFFPLHNGAIQMSDHNYYNSATGNLTTGPSVVPSNERIIAQTNDGNYISSNEINSMCWGCGLFYAGQIFIHTNSGLTSAPLNINNYAKIIFNPFTNKLYIKINNILSVYLIVGNTFSLLSQTTITGDLVQITNTDKIFVVNNYQLKEMLLPSGTYSSPLSILGFNNNNLGVNGSSGTFSDNPYSENKVLVNNTTNNFIYSIDLTNMTSKGIQVSYSPFYNTRYAYYGDNVYLTFSINPPFTIGNQQIPLIGNSGTLCGFTKLNLQTDFSFARPNSTSTEVTKAQAPKPSFEVILSPNPASNYLSIIITDIKANKQPYTLNFKNLTTNKTITKQTYYSGSPINISSLQKGFHYVEITNGAGEVVVAKFLKM